MGDFCAPCGRDDGNHSRVLHQVAAERERVRAGEAACGLVPAGADPEGGGCVRVGGHEDACYLPDPDGASSFNPPGLVRFEMS